MNTIIALTCLVSFGFSANAMLGQEDLTIPPTTKSYLSALDKGLRCAEQSQKFGDKGEGVLDFKKYVTHNNEIVPIMQREMVFTFSKIEQYSDISNEQILSFYKDKKDFFNWLDKKSDDLETLESFTKYELIKDNDSSTSSGEEFKNPSLEDEWNKNHPYSVLYSSYLNNNDSETKSKINSHVNTKINFYQKYIDIIELSERVTLTKEQMLEITPMTEQHESDIKSAFTTFNEASSIRKNSPFYSFATELATLQKNVLGVIFKDEMEYANPAYTEFSSKLDKWKKRVIAEKSFYKSLTLKK
ncbi:MAG TPA: hypothetical protein VI959_02310 [Alphaproteobacteria bacterium]|nr:hypothetical protein [Alphaproteobacteria bacterium]